MVCLEKMDFISNKDLEESAQEANEFVKRADDVLKAVTALKEGKYDYESVRILHFPVLLLIRSDFKRYKSGR